MALTSPSVKPNLSSERMENTLFTVRLFNPEKMSAFATCITPVM